MLSSNHKFTPHFTSIFILYVYLRPGIPSGLLFQDLATQILYALLTCTVRETVTSKDNVIKISLLTRCMKNLTSLIPMYHRSGCHLYHSTTNLTQHGEYRRPLYLPARLPFHVRHLGRRIKHCMCWKSNFNRNITDHFIKRSVLDLISAHNNVQIPNTKTLKRRPVRGALLTMFIVNLNIHELRNMATRARSSKINPLKTKRRPPYLKTQSLPRS